MTRPPLHHTHTGPLGGFSNVHSPRPAWRPPWSPVLPSSALLQTPSQTNHHKARSYRGSSLTRHPKGSFYRVSLQTDLHYFLTLHTHELNVQGHLFSFLEVKSAKVTQSCLTLCDPMDYTVHGILQARILEWVAFPFSKGASQPRDQTQVSRIAGGFFTS